MAHPNTWDEAEQLGTVNNIEVWKCQTAGGATIYELYNASYDASFTFNEDDLVDLWVTLLDP